jgi:hypothetical protein
MARWRWIWRLLWVGLLLADRGGIFKAHGTGSERSKVSKVSKEGA